MARVQTFHLLTDSDKADPECVLTAALEECQPAEPTYVRYPLMRSDSDVTEAFSSALASHGIVVYALLDSDLRHTARVLTRKLNVPSIDLIGPVIMRLTDLLEIAPGARPDLFRHLDELYFRRIEAIEFAVAHDDGRRVQELDRSEIILTGVSRTSKTPLSMYLATHGWLVANVPIVLGLEMPHQVFDVDPDKVFGLVMRSERLAMLRRVRLTRLGMSAPDNYADSEHVTEELAWAQEVFRRGKSWTIIDVTSRSIEESASEIIDLLNRRSRSAKEEA